MIRVLLKKRKEQISFEEMLLSIDWIINVYKINILQNLLRHYHLPIYLNE